MLLYWGFFHSTLTKHVWQVQKQICNWGIIVFVIYGKLRKIIKEICLTLLFWYICAKWRCFCYSMQSLYTWATKKPTISSYLLFAFVLLQFGGFEINITLEQRKSESRTINPLNRLPEYVPSVERCSVCTTNVKYFGCQCVIFLSML